MSDLHGNFTAQQNVFPTQNFDKESPPEPLWSDYVQLTYLGIFFLIGAPLNLAAFSDITAQKPNLSNSSLGRMHLLKRHLNISDLLVVMIYAPSQACWLLTYNWRAGYVMCKMIKFLHSLAFQISSNIIVCIALDRLFSVLNPRSSQGVRRVKILLLFAWVTALLLCMPQMFIWTTFEPYKGWHQCVSIWLIEDWSHRHNSSETISTFSFLLGKFGYDLEQTYNISHLVFVFWAPLVCIALSYLVVLCWVAKHSNRAVKGQFLKSPSLPTNLQDSGRKPFRAVTFKSTADSERSTKRKNENVVSTNGQMCVKYAQLGSEAEITECQAPNISAVEVSRLERLNSQVLVRKRKAIRISVLLVAVYVACWLPYSTLSMWELFAKEQWKIYSDKLDFIHSLVVLNSVINPFLYGMFGRVNRFTKNG